MTPGVWLARWDFIQDPVRLRVLFALSASDELCVGDVALALGSTDDAVSYALKLLRTAGRVSFRKHELSPPEWCASGPVMGVA